VNTHTLGCFCTARIGGADIDVASLAVDKLVAETYSADYELSGETTLLSPE
jgi:hypothetical protein